MTRTVLVLAMHGARPRDYPADEAAELSRLHADLEHAKGPARAALEQRHDTLEAEMRAWPRTAGNDPFHAASHRLAAKLATRTGWEVVVGFNEFCAPSVSEAIEEAVAKGAGQVLVTTTMLTRGGLHAERDIPALVEKAQARHPGVRIAYAWPIAEEDVAAMMAAHLRRFAAEGSATSAPRR